MSALVAHSVQCLRLSQYFLFLKITMTAVFSICFGNTSDGLGFRKLEGVSGVCSATGC